MSNANKYQVGGAHYQQEGGGEQHWDRIWRLYGRGYFVGCITKYVERYHLKHGVQDLNKAKHFLEKLIELEEANQPVRKASDTEPDRNCVTLPDGACVSDQDCMHGPGVVFSLPEEIAADGWVGYTFKGADPEGFLYTHRKCRQTFYVPHYTNPNRRHNCPEEGDATPAYVAQAAT